MLPSAAGVVPEEAAAAVGTTLQILLVVTRNEDLEPGLCNLRLLF
jgi:hypothetical protein